MRLLNNNIFTKYLSYELIKYPTYSNLSYFWNFGFLSFIFLFIQILTGICLAMFYISGSEHAFLSIEHIMRDINYGWLIRYCHSNGASFFFLRVYLHMFRNIYYNSFIKPRQFVWFLGIIILVCMILTAFLGYVLPWGQMSFWAATVITNLFSAIPYFGAEIVIWLWGGFSVDGATLTKFFSLHYLFPFIIFLLTILHVFILHRYGSTNPVGIYLQEDKILFYPYYFLKDFWSLILIIMLFSFFVFFYPNYLGHTDNYIMANMLVTPQHIVPEWYLLVFYAILRSIPNKLGGILILGLVIIFLFILPLLTSSLNKSSWFFNFYKLFFWVFIVICLLLEWIGQQPMEYPFLQIGQLCTIFYLLYFVQMFMVIDYVSYYLNRS